MLLLAPPAAIAGPGEETPDKIERLDSVVVSASRAGDKTPITFTMIGREELRTFNPIHSLPMNLALQPSVVTWNEGGTGLGNSTMTVRGSKGSQINVTLNGITLNDAESQEVFWVNIPSLTGLISSVQLQRGLGTSANGSGAFGASVNMNTASVSARPFADADFSAGSWNTCMTRVAAGTGRGKSGFYAHATYSRGLTDGYIRNAKVESRSAFAVLGWMNERNSLRLTYLMGDQRSGITWNGISRANYAIDRRYNDAGEYKDEYGNVRYYDNQIDAYNQHHLQLNYTRAFSNVLFWTTTANYTRGYGYDEYYKPGRALGEFGFPSPLTGLDGREHEKADLIYRKKMGNHLYVLNSDLKFSGERLVLTGGVYCSRYLGDHWGEMLWNQVLGDSYDYASMNAARAWYSNNAVKQEASGFARGEYAILPRLTIYADLQLRRIDLDMIGADDDAASIDYVAKWTFFNPRAGFHFDLGEGHQIYLSAAFGHREPGRSDIKENVKGILSPIEPEKMLDLEAGWQYASERYSTSANLYLMEYWDMLLETGRLSTSGYAIKENVPRGWRRGIELTASWLPTDLFRVDANASFSVNRLKNFTAHVDRFDHDWISDANPGWNKMEQARETYSKTTMLLSPSIVSMLRCSCTPFKRVARGSLKTTTLSLDGKYVGKQYWDNTANADRCVPAYFVSNLSVCHEFDLGTGKLGLAGYVNNLFNRTYYASAWVYRAVFAEGGAYQEEGLYPQPPINFLLKLSYRF